ncbi:Crp/Fnr family transcriptional regulator [Thioalkalivibrio thiocyanodenitrificans]|uniref:Crp/Fnr family transcriptional regulator n=1 Tax=Thioalkalivibrio thiocyanodenitrificans TaxID=243063 RepID=UPI00037B0708|nr:cyclic nucleotide-binding domain-containing protein [Thioalkalivibrio thiocyanodenitrificans]
MTADLFERILLLKQSPIFDQLPTEDLGVVARHLEEERYFSGDRVFDLGEHGDRVYFLLSGRIGVYLRPTRAAEEFLTELGPGECFGEMNLLDGLPRSATAHVLDDSVVLSLEKSKLRGLIINYPELSLGMLKSLSLRLRKANLRSRDI